MPEHEKAELLNDCGTRGWGGGEGKGIKNLFNFFLLHSGSERKEASMNYMLNECKAKPKWSPNAGFPPSRSWQT